MSRKIEIDVEDYIDLLQARKDFVEEKYGWNQMPDCLWDYFCDLIRERGVGSNSNPAFIVDNAILNGDWGDFDDYKDSNESDEEFVERVNDDVQYINETERVVCFSISINQNGCSVCKAGKEKYTKFRPAHLPNQVLYQYDYRDKDGELFSAVAPTLEQCRTTRDKWVLEKIQKNKKLTNNEIIN